MDEGEVDTRPAPASSPATLAPAETAQGRHDVFLPDFCAIPVVFSVVIIGELLAFVLVLAGAGAGRLEPAIGGSWANLAVVSLFIQWVGLSSAALLCLLRPVLSKLSDGRAGVAALAVVLIVTGLATETAYWMVQARWSTLAPSGLGRSLTTGEHVRVVLANLGVALIVSAVALRYFYVQHRWRRQVERESSARIQALHSRIRPHFLFNSMNTIAAYTRSQPEVAEQLVEDLADLFRVSLRDAAVPSTLGEELEVCRQYARIEQRRLGERMTVQWQTDGLPLDAALPALTLQPLLENAVYHGIEPARENGVILIEGTIEGPTAGRQVTLTITNPRGQTGAGPGVGARPSGHQLALANVRERMLAFFGSSAEFTAGPEGERFRVSCRFPVRDGGSGARAQEVVR